MSSSCRPCPRNGAAERSRGLRARGAFEFSLAWEDGRLTWATILACRGGSVTVRHAGASATYTLGMGENATWTPASADIE